MEFVLFVPHCSSFMDLPQFNIQLDWTTHSSLIKNNAALYCCFLSAVASVLLVSEGILPSSNPSLSAWLLSVNASALYMD